MITLIKQILDFTLHAWNKVFKARKLSQSLHTTLLLLFTTTIIMLVLWGAMMVSTVVFLEILR
jgi:hypothetical protein